MAHKLVMAVLACTLAMPPLAARAGDDVPPDRQPLDLPPPPKSGKGTSVDLPPPPSDDGTNPETDAGQVGWSRSTAAQLERDRRMVLVEGAFGGAGAIAGLGVTFLIISFNQPDAGIQHGWQVAALVCGGVATAMLVTGTVLWLTAPKAPVSAALVPTGTGLALAVRF